MQNNALVLPMSSLYFKESKKVISFFSAFIRGLIEFTEKSSLNLFFGNNFFKLIFFFLKKIFEYIGLI